MYFLGVVLAVTTILLCYAGYVFLIVDKRQQKQIEDSPEVFSQLDDKEYLFDLPAEVEEYDELRDSKPADKRTLPVALLKRAMADIPRIEQLEKDHPRMARLFQRGLLPNSVWEQILEAEAMMDSEVHEVQAEAEKLHKGWGQSVFGQAYQMLRKEREAIARMKALRRDAAVLKLDFTKPSGGEVQIIAEGRNVTQQTQLNLRKGCESEEVAYKCEVRATLTVGEGSGEGERTYKCASPEIVLDREQEKQWKQLGQDVNALRLQIKFVRRRAALRCEPPAPAPRLTRARVCRPHGIKNAFCVADIRATIPALAVSNPEQSKAESTSAAD